MHRTASLAVRRFLFALSLLAVPATVSGAELSAREVAQWREDLRFVREQLAQRQPLLFAGLTPTHLTEPELDRAVAELDRALPHLSRSRAIVGLERIVAMAGAGHTSINPLFDASLGFRTYPLRLYSFRDGLFVVAADRAHADLLGARVVRVGEFPVDSALARVGTVLSHENEPFLRAQGPVYLMIPEVLDALGIAPDMERLTLTVELHGTPQRVVVAPAGPLPLRTHAAGAPAWLTDAVDLRPPSAPPPLWLSHPGTPRWFEYLPATRTLYVAFQSSVDPGAVSGFIDRVLAAADSLAPDHLVIDCRDNLGGDSYFNRKLVLGLVRRPALDRPGHLFAVIGRGTYSAAQDLVNELERWTAVTFVGEPTGSPPSFFGDHVTVRLPNSHIGLNIATDWWQVHDARDHRPFVAPRLYAEPTAADYRAGVDPVMDVLHASYDAPGLASQLGAALADGDTTRAARDLAAFRADPVNRYAAYESELNGVGYARLHAGRLAEAATAFRLGARAFPESANAWDSLGECYERMGYNAAAREQYARAIALMPEMASSREGLARLGDAVGSEGR